MITVRQLALLSSLVAVALCDETSSTVRSSDYYDDQELDHYDDAHPQESVPKSKWLKKTRRPDSLIEFYGFSRAKREWSSFAPENYFVDYNDVDPYVPLYAEGPDFAIPGTAPEKPPGWNILQLLKKYPKLKFASLKPEESKSNIIS